MHKYKHVSSVKPISLYKKLHYMNECHVIFCRSAGKSNLSAGDLVSKLGEACSQWPKACLQVVHKLWTQHGPLVHSQQEVQALLSIGQACLFLLLYSHHQCRGSLLCLLHSVYCNAIFQAILCIKYMHKVNFQNSVSLL